MKPKTLKICNCNQSTILQVENKNSTEISSDLIELNPLIKNAYLMCSCKHGKK